MNRNHLFKILASTILVVVACTGVLQGQNVVTDWNGIASTTIVKNAGNGPSSAAVYFAYAAIASYDAVNAIDRRYRPVYYHGRAWGRASEEAAAAAAAHTVLVYYFPKQQTALDTSFSDSLAKIQASDDAKNAGIAAGEASAAALIAARDGDGVGANVPYTPGSGPGVWQPTPPGFLPAQTPWVGQMRPFAMESASQFLPPGPTALDSAEWERDYNITRVLGAANSTVRTPKQTETAIFWTENTAQQYARLLTNIATQHQLNLRDTARLMAMVWTGIADAAIGCYNAKYHYSFWRPVTAIQAGGGNPDLTNDPNWISLGTTPNHPEYPAAHGALTGALTSLLAEYFGTSKVQIAVDSLAFKDGPHTHVFADTRDILKEVEWARIYAGFHFYNSVVHGGELGRKAGANVARKYFGRAGDRDDDR
jgi:hypothetical protein